MTRLTPPFRAEPLEDRLAPRAGDLDLAFGVQGKADVLQGMNVNDMAVMADGRIVLVGISSNDFGIVRLTANGAPDPTFGTNGLATVGFDLGGRFEDEALAVAVRPDGGLVVAGRASTANSGGKLNLSTSSAAAVAVLTPDGKPDPAFKTDGKISFPWLDNLSSRASRVRLLPDGSFVVAQGEVPEFMPDNDFHFLGFDAARFRPDGTFDAGFGQGGRATFSDGRVAKDADIAPDGGVVGLLSHDAVLVSGERQTTYTMARLTPAGVFDTGFGSNGMAVVRTITSGPDDSVSASLTATPDGRLVVSFYRTVFVGGTNSEVYAGSHRFLSNGTPDIGFGVGGQRADFTYGTVDGLSEGRNLALGWERIVGNGPTIGRYAADGNRDLGFGDNGGVSAATLESYGLTSATNGLLRHIGRIAVTPDGGVLVFHQSRLIRLMGDAPVPAVTNLSGVTAVGAGPGGGPTVAFRSAAGAEAGGLQPFNPAPPGGVRVAAVDLNGDGTADLIAGTGPGVPTRVRVTDGVTRRELFAIDPFETSFTGGVYVAAGDTTGDGVPELVITPDEGGGPRVRVFDGKTFGLVADFFGIEDTNFRGGARAAVGDVNGDKVGDLVVAAGFLGGPRVAGFNGTTLASGPVKVFSDFFAFEQALRNGVFLAVGDIDGDTFAEVIAGGGPGGGPRVTAFSGKGLAINQTIPVANFFGGNPDNRGGIRVAVKDLDGDARADLVVGAGTGAGSRVTAYLGKTISTAGTPPAAFDFDAIVNFTGGVYVG